MGNLCLSEKEMDHICGDIDSVECGATQIKPKTVKMARKSARRGRKPRTYTVEFNSEELLSASGNIADLAGCEAGVGELKKGRSPSVNSYASNLSASTKASS